MSLVCLFARKLSLPILLGVLSLCSLSARAQYSVIDLGTLGGTTSNGASINQSGHVTGAATDAAGVSHAFLWVNGQMTDLGTAVGYDQSRGRALNSQDQVAGIVEGYPEPTSLFHASLYQNGVMTDLGALPLSNGQTPQSQTYAINDKGQVVGSSVAQISAGTTVNHAILWDPVTGMHDLTPTYSGIPGALARGINNAGQIVGSLGSDAFLYSGGTLQDLTTATGVRFNPNDINAASQIVGGQTTNISVGIGVSYGQGVLYQSGQAHILTPLAGFGGSNLTSINSLGQSVGSVFNFNNSAVMTAQDAILYLNSQILDLNSLIPTDSGWHLNSASDINDSGMIVGQGTINGQLHGFLLVSTPEPGTEALLAGLGFLGSGIVLQRRRRRQRSGQKG